MPKVSIIIPIYNVEKYIEDCLDSVLSQTFEDIEVICVNDRSRDRSFDKVKEYASRDNRIILHENESNYGLSYTRNKGLNIATGEYVYFLDSDDMIDKDAIEGLYDIAALHSLDVVFFDAKLLFETDEFKLRYGNYKSKRNGTYQNTYNGTDLFMQFIHNDDWVTSVPRQFIKRSFLMEKQLCFYEGILHEDELFTFVMLLQADRVRCIQQEYFIRRFREASIMTNDISLKNVAGIVTCYFEMLHYWQNSKFDEAIDTTIDNHMKKLHKTMRYRFRMLQDQERLEAFTKGDIKLQHLLRTIFYTDMNHKLLPIELSEDVIMEIKKYPKVIVYGAGAVARIVLDVLDQNDIGIHGFAVSDINQNSKSVLGNTIYQIDELQSLKDEAVVLVAVKSSYHGEIIRNLKRLGFETIIPILY